MNSVKLSLERIVRLEDAKKIIETAISPMSLDDFFDNIYGKKYCLMRGDNKNKNHLMLGDDPKSTILNDYEKYAAHLTSHIHTATAPPPKSRQVNSAKEFADLIGEFHALDYTVRIPDVINMSTRLNEFTRAIEVLFGNPTGVVIFWSDTKAEAPVHYDEIDIFVVQLVGKKKWFLSDTPTDFPNAWNKVGEQAPTLNEHTVIDVGPGDVMYVPRGTTHTVISTDESIHLSIGFLPVTVRDAIISTIDLLSEFDPALRQHLGNRADDLSSGKNAQKMVEQIVTGIEKLKINSQSVPFIQHALSSRHRRMLLDLPKVPKKEIKIPISTKTQLKHNSMLMSQLLKGEEMLEVVQPGDKIVINPGIEAQIQYIVSTPSFCAADIPGEFANDDERLFLVSKFIETGFLEVAE